MPPVLFRLLLGFLLLSFSKSQAQQSGSAMLTDGSATSSGRAAAPARTDSATAPTTPSTAVYHTAEQMPAFPGGAEAFQKFLRKELRYPDEGLRHNVSGKVYVRFLITEEGRIRDAQIIKGLGSGLDEEALRLVRIMPWWTPGRNAGRPVPVLYTMPIIFRALE